MLKNMFKYLVCVIIELKNICQIKQRQNGENEYMK